MLGSGRGTTSSEGFSAPSHNGKLGSRGLSGSLKNLHSLLNTELLLVFCTNIYIINYNHIYICIHIVFYEDWSHQFIVEYLWKHCLYAPAKSPGMLGSGRGSKSWAGCSAPSHTRTHKNPTTKQAKIGNLGV